MTVQEIETLKKQLINPLYWTLAHAIVRGDDAAVMAYKDAMMEVGVADDLIELCADAYTSLRVQENRQQWLDACEQTLAQVVRGEHPTLMCRYA